MINNLISQNNILDLLNNNGFETNRYQVHEESLEFNKVLKNYKDTILSDKYVKTNDNSISIDGQKIDENEIIVFIDNSDEEENDALIALLSNIYNCLYGKSDNEVRDAISNLDKEFNIEHIIEGDTSTTTNSNIEIDFVSEKIVNNNFKYNAFNNIINSTKEFSCEDLSSEDLSTFDNNLTNNEHISNKILGVDNNFNINKDKTIFNNKISNNQNINDIINKLTSFGQAYSNVEDLQTTSKALIQDILKSIQRETLEINKNKKKEILLNSPNLELNAFSKYSVGVISQQQLADLREAELHPTIKQILQIIESQIDFNDLSNKTLNLRLKLFPSELGKIAVNIKSTNKFISIDILSSNNDVVRLLSNSINELEAEFANKTGYSVNVNISSEDFNNGFNNNSNSQKQETTYNKNIREDNSIKENDISLKSYYIDLENNKVNIQI